MGKVGVLGFRTAIIKDVLKHLAHRLDGIENLVVAPAGGFPRFIPRGRTCVFDALDVGCEGIRTGIHAHGGEIRGHGLERGTHAGDEAEEGGGAGDGRGIGIFAGLGGGVGEIGGEVVPVGAGGVEGEGGGGEREEGEEEDRVFHGSERANLHG